MARLILKSPYIKSTGGAAGYLRYIATRERVEILPDDRPPTRKQEQLIAKLVKDFPDTKTLYEYESYQAKPTKAAASAFLALALESNWDALRQSEQYLKYIATRPRAERLGSHGLFGDSDGVYWKKRWRNWSSTPEMCGRTSSLSSGRTRRGWASTTPRHGEISSAPTATRSRRR